MQCNTGFAKVAVQCSADTFVVNQTLVLRINICGKNCHFAQLQTVMLHAMPTTDKIKNKTAKALPSFSYILAYEIDKIEKYL
jgi:hypothetical protein